MRKVKEDYENEIKALRARLLGCEAAGRRLASAFNSWAEDGHLVGTLAWEDFSDRFYDLYHLAWIDAPLSFEMEVDEKGGEEYKARLIFATSALAAIRDLVASQSEDEGLWFQARTAPEAYLQQELRRLHALIEVDEKEG